MGSHLSDGHLTSPSASRVAGAVASLTGTRQASDLVRDADRGMRRGARSRRAPGDRVKVRAGREADPDQEALAIPEARAGTGRARVLVVAASADAKALFMTVWRSSSRNAERVPAFGGTDASQWRVQK